MVIMMANFRGYLLETKIDLLMVRCLALIKASNSDLLMVK